MDIQKRTDYVACYHFSQNHSGDFINLKTRDPINNLAASYSLAKYGSYKDLKFFAQKIVERFYVDIDNPISTIRNFFQNFRPKADYVILMTPGYRNVKASGNIMFDIALPYINAKLTTLGFPVIADFKLLRIVDPCPNYAMLSLEERAITSSLTDHILPGASLYRNRRLHVIYGDDIYVTGESSEKAKADALSKGAQSFLSIFAVMMDAAIAQRHPGIEEELNQSHVTEKLDDSALEIYSQPEMIPVIRSLEILLCAKNLLELPNFLSKIPLANALKIYTYYMANESSNHSQFLEGLIVLRQYLYNHQLVDRDGLPVWK